MEASIQAHDIKQVSKEQHKGEAGEYVQSIVFGGLDGIITTFAVVAAAAATGLTYGMILIIGFANLVGDAFGMGVGDFISSKAEDDHEISERKREAWELENLREVERDEMIQIYVAKGVLREDAVEVVDLLLNASKSAFLDVMMVEELGIMPKEVGTEAWKGGLITFGSFMILGGIPMLPYLFSGTYSRVGKLDDVFGAAVALFSISLFTLGAFKGHITGKKWWKTGITMLINGGLTTFVAYLLGTLLEGVVQK